MKAIKDCKWVVAIEESKSFSGSYLFAARTKDDTGTMQSQIIMWEYAGSIDETKVRWEQFAKLNDIKDWEYEK